MVQDIEDSRRYIELRGAIPNSQEYIVVTPGSPMHLIDVRNQIQKANKKGKRFDGFPSSYIFTIKGRVVPDIDEAKTELKDCVIHTNDNGKKKMKIILRIDFKKLTHVANSIKGQFDHKARNDNLQESLVGAAKASSAVLEQVSKIGDFLDKKVGENAAALEKVAGALSYAPMVGVAFAFLVPALSALNDGRRLDEETTNVLGRLRRLLSYLDEVMEFIKVKGGKDPEGDITFCSIMVLVDQCITTILDFKPKFLGRIEKAWRANRNLMTLEDLDDKITKLVLERNVIESLKSFRALSLDMVELKRLGADIKEELRAKNEDLDQKLEELVHLLDERVANGEITQRKLEKMRKQLQYQGSHFRIGIICILVLLVSILIRQDKNVLTIVAEIEDNRSAIREIGMKDNLIISMLAPFVGENYPNISESYRETIRHLYEMEWGDRNIIQNDFQIDSVLESEIYFNVVFLTFAFALFEDEEKHLRFKQNDRISVVDLQTYLDSRMDHLAFSEDQMKLFGTSMEFLSSLKDHAVLHSFDQEPDHAYGVFINSQAKRVMVVFRPLLVSPGNPTSEWLKSISLRLTDIPLSSKLRKMLNIKDLEKVSVHSGYYQFACAKFLKIKMLLLELAESKKYKDYTLFVSGHSFGAAIANIVAFLIMSNDSFEFEHPLTLTTFGSPRVGNLAWKKIFSVLGQQDKLWYLRVSTEKDSIPRLPPSWFWYYHSGMHLHLRDSGEYAFSNDYVRTALFPSLSPKDHSLVAYWKLITPIKEDLHLKSIRDLYVDAKFYGSLSDTHKTSWIPWRALLNRELEYN